MKKTVICSIVIFVMFFVAILTGMTNKADGAEPKTIDYGCVSGPEWQDLQIGLDSPNGSARRSIIETSWDVVSIGYRNEYWQPGNPKIYSLAYSFCSDPEVVIVIGYRKSSGSWQFAIKGA